MKSGSSLFTLIYLLAIMAIFFLFLYLPERNRIKRHQKMIDSLKKGDKVVAAGGIIGIVHSVKPSTIVLKVADNVKIEVVKNSITAVIESRDDTSQK